EVISEAVALALSGLSVTTGVDVVVEQGLDACADRGRIVQIVRNLIENALKYGESPVAVKGRGENGVVIVEVSDSGRIPHELMSKIVSKYWRRERSGRPSGTGLGLAIARDLAHAQGGALTAHSSDAGTVFRLVLPRD